VRGTDRKTGDFIVADDNGVVVIPRERRMRLQDGRQRLRRNERRIRDEIKRGKTLSEVLYLEKWEKK